MSVGACLAGALTLTVAVSKALVAPSIRPDTIFIPFHYGHRDAVNQLTNPAVDRTVKIPEYKACAATVEKLDAVQHDASPNGTTVNFTPEDAPRMFPYAVGETKDRPEKEAKAY